MNAPLNAFAGWTEAAVATAHKMWLDGASAREIAAALGHGCTRNAVIGKLHRTKLFSRDAPVMARVTPGKPAPRRARVVESKIKQPEPRPAPPPKQESAGDAPKIDINAPLPASRPTTLFDLQPHQCRWPLGDPKIDTFRFCGAAREDEHPYCKTHRLAARRTEA